MHLLLCAAADKKIGDTLDSLDVLSDFIFKKGLVALDRTFVALHGLEDHPDDW